MSGKDVEVCKSGKELERAILAKPSVDSGGS